MLLPLVCSDRQGPGSHWSAHIADTEVLELESLFALEMQSPRTVRTCPTVGTTRSREAGINSSGHKRLPRL